VLQQQFGDPVRRLVSRKMAGPGQHLEVIGRGNEIHRTLGGGPPDGVVGTVWKGLNDRYGS
jgi:hypothetical protein